MHGGKGGVERVKITGRMERREGGERDVGKVDSWVWESREGCRREGKQEEGEREGKQECKGGGGEIGGEREGESREGCMREGKLEEIWERSYTCSRGVGW